MKQIILSVDGMLFDGWISRNDKDMEVNFMGGGGYPAYINKDDAIKIINHLSKVFDLNGEAQERGGTAEMNIRECMREDGSLYNRSVYINWDVGDEGVTLDGKFNVEELEAIIKHIKSIEAQER